MATIYTEQPISALAPENIQLEGIKVTKKQNLGNLLLWFIGIAVIVYIILAITKPTWVQQKDLAGLPNGTLNQGTTIIISIVVAIIIVGLIYLLNRG